MRHLPISVYLGVKDPPGIFQLVRHDTGVHISRIILVIQLLTVFLQKFNRKLL